MGTPVEKAWLMADPGKTLAVESANGVTVLKVPAQAPDANSSVIGVRVNGDVPRYRSLMIGGKVTASEKEGEARGLVNPGGGNWRIPSQSGTVQVNMGKPTTFSVLRLTTPYTTATKIALEVKDGEAWKPVYSEENPKGMERVKTFAPVTGQVVRLTVTADKPGVRIGVFELFPPL